MSKATLILALTAALGLAACTNDADQAARNANLVPLLDATGTPVMYVPLSATRGAPVGTPVTINRNGSLQTLTLGERQGGTTAGNVTIVGSGADGAPIIERIGGTGSVAQEGSAVVTGSSGGNLTTSRVATGTGLSARQRRAIAASRAAQGTTPATTPAATPAR